MDPEPHLVVVGSGEREPALRAYVSDKGSRGRATGLGWRKDLPQVFPAFDVTALTSFDEGTPVSLIESLASGTPVVSLAVGGVPEILEGGELGRLVYSASDDEVADALESVLATPPVAWTMRSGARRLVLERFFDSTAGRGHRTSVRGCSRARRRRDLNKRLQEFTNDKDS